MIGLILAAFAMTYENGGLFSHRRLLWRIDLVTKCLEFVGENQLRNPCPRIALPPILITAHFPFTKPRSHTKVGKLALEVIFLNDLSLTRTGISPCFIVCLITSRSNLYLL